MNTGNGWTGGPSDAIDRKIGYGHDAREISEMLHVDRWVVIERFSARLLFDTHVT